MRALSWGERHSAEVAVAAARLGARGRSGCPARAPFTARVYARIVGLVQRRDRVGVETAAIAALVDLDGKQVLDVGCGGGRLTGFAAVRAAYVYAFDPEAENVAKASATLAAESRERVRFAVHDAEALDVERRRFDVALCGWSL
jgi:2-polyprenyl-3-methyl-5-hydroxy-6-metoxy-1,4-benzoquinol methylase